MRAIEDKFIRENLMIQPVKQAPNPYIPNEADRIFVPKDDSLLRMARSLEAYNPNLKKWADRHEGELMEKARSQAMEELSQNGGLDHVKKKYFENPNLDGVNPYLHREIGKEVLKQKALQYNAAVKLAYDEQNWSSLSPDEFMKKLTGYRGEWEKANQADLSMADSRDFPEVFDKVHDATMEVVSEGYYRELASRKQQQRENLHQEMLTVDIETNHRKLKDEADAAGVTLSRDFNYDDIADFDSYKTLKGFIKDKDIYNQIINTNNHYIKNLGMPEDKAYKSTLATLKNMAKSGDGDGDVYVAIASLLRDAGEKRDENGNITSTLMDKAEFAAWAAETEKAAITAYQDRSERERKEYTADYQRRQLTVNKEFYNEIALMSSKEVKNASPEELFNRLNEKKWNKNLPEDMRPTVTTLLTNAQNSYIGERTFVHYDRLDDVLLKLYKGGYSDWDAIKNAADTLHPQDRGGVYALFEKQQSEGTNPNRILADRAASQVAQALKVDGFYENDINTFLNSLTLTLGDWIDEETKSGKRVNLHTAQQQAIRIRDEMFQNPYWESRENKLRTQEQVAQKTSSLIPQVFLDETLNISPLKAEQIKNDPTKMEEARQDLQAALGGSYKVTDEDVINYLDSSVQFYNTLREKMNERELQHKAKKIQMEKEVTDYFSRPDVQAEFIRAYPDGAENILRGMGVEVQIKGDK